MPIRIASRENAAMWNYRFDVGERVYLDVDWWGNFGTIEERFPMNGRKCYCIRRKHPKVGLDILIHLNEEHIRKIDDPRHYSIWSHMVNAVRREVFYSHIRFRRLRLSIYRRFMILYYVVKCSLPKKDLHKHLMR